ncbi:MAG: redoxin family protein [Pirellulales bacterium]|nr:redoxin family protein [Pirellulales bacterium]
MFRYLMGIIWGVMAVVGMGYGLPQGSAAEPEPHLLPGAPAPKIAVAEWINGEKVTEFAPDKIYVLDFWATWCEPCKKTIPELSKLQQKFTDQGVVFLGICISEDESGDAADFVKKLGKKLTYSMALDDMEEGEEGAMTLNWLDAAEQDSIPVVFVVQNQKIAWIGHPDELAPILPQIVEKKWDIEKAKSEYLAAAIQNRKLLEIQDKLDAAIEGQKPDEALAAIDELVKLEPDAAKEANALKFLTLIEMDATTEAYKMGDKLLEEYKDDAETLNEISWAILDTEDLSERDLDLSLKVAERANTVAKGEAPEILDTLARAHYEKGNVDKAIEFQSQAVEKVPADEKELKKELQKTLKAYQAKKAV